MPLTLASIDQREVCDSVENIQVIIYCAVRGSAGGSIKLPPSAVCVQLQTKLVGLFWAVLARAHGVGVHVGSGKEVATLHGFACDGRYVGLEGTLDEAGVRSGSRIEVLLGLVGGAAEKGSCKATGQSLLQIQLPQVRCALQFDIRCILNISFACHSILHLHSHELVLMLRADGQQ